MPVTARLSRKFYETFGEDVTNELVDWFNSVDATYRNDLRELNELNFGRFDGKLEQRLAQFDAKLEQRLAQFDAKLEQRLAELDTRWGTRLGTVESRLVALDAKLDQRLAELKSDLIKWMFGFWVPTALGIIGTAIAVVALLLRK